MTKIVSSYVYIIECEYKTEPITQAFDWYDFHWPFLTQSSRSRQHLTLNILFSEKVRDFWKKKTTAMDEKLERLMKDWGSCSAERIQYTLQEDLAEEDLIWFDK